LQDINFEVKKGEILGIIGKNGAGKSTLLKILSRITSPTKGNIKIQGRMASLLEVGTGFHPELTGRENIYLNGAILGMRKTEINKQFDEIVEFSGCARYIDTPVKRYSSGMTVRLGFAVAAFLQPEILVVDEVLAVGDAEFQKKCLGKMKDVSGEGRTVLFVSHNMAAVKSLCNQALVMNKGQLSFEGTVSNAVANYLVGGAQFSNSQEFNNKFLLNIFELNKIQIFGEGKKFSEAIDEYDAINIKINLIIKTEKDSLHFTLVLKDDTGEPIFTFSHINSGVILINGENNLICKLPKGFLNIGSYHLDAYLIKNGFETVFVEKDIISFHVQEGERPIGSWMGKEPGLIKPNFEWLNYVK
jgi:lipopolysaccharide transport system ATP-binding protein